jgi:HK97 gp10 family phage protein
MRSTSSFKGLDDYLAKIEAAGRNVDDAVAEAISDAAPVIEEHMHKLLRASSEAWTGATEATLFKTPVKRDGNYTFIEIGADVSRDPAGLYKEFGTARQGAEPFMRPAFTQMRHQWRNKLKAALKRLGVA